MSARMSTTGTVHVARSTQSVEAAANALRAQGGGHQRGLALLQANGCVYNIACAESMHAMHLLSFKRQALQG